MPADVLVLNTAVTDFRGEQFSFVQELVGPGGLAKRPADDLPPYTQEQYGRWISAGQATAGGPGNAAPLMTRAGLSVAVGANLGAGDFDGLDAPGRFFHDTLARAGVDLSMMRTHRHLPTGATFIYEAPGDERGGIVYFPNANDDFDLDHFARATRRAAPHIVYYMYSGLSVSGDANGGRDLAAFMRACRNDGCLTIADSHTLTADPAALIAADEGVEAYRLLEPLLSELDIFVTSLDEARLIAITLDYPATVRSAPDETFAAAFLTETARRFARDDDTPRMLGVTFARGAVVAGARGAEADSPVTVVSPFLAGEVVDLVGAGDSFRAGLLTYVSGNMLAFRDGRIDLAEAAGMGNLFASLFIKAPLGDRYAHIRPYEEMLPVVRSGKTYQTFPALIAAIDGSGRRHGG